MSTPFSRLSAADRFTAVTIMSQQNKGVIVRELLDRLTVQELVELLARYDVSTRQVTQEDN